MGMTSTKYGGLEKFLLSLIKQSPKSFQYILVYDDYPKSNQFVDELKKYNVEIIVNTIGRFRFISEILSYVKLIIHFRPQIVHFHFSTLHFIGALISKVLRVPKIYKTQHSCITTTNYAQVTSYEDLPLKQKLYSFLGNGVKLYTKIFFVSQYTYNQFVKIYGLSRRYKQVYLGVELPGYKSTITKSDLGIAESDAVLASILFSNPIKGADVLIRAMAGINDSILLLIGLDESVYTNDLIQLAKKTGVYNRIRWIGISDNVSQYLRVCDIYIQPSRTEALSIAACEALSYGKPVIGSNVGGLPEVSSILFKNEDDIDLSNCISKLLNDKELYQDLSNEAYQEYNLKFNIAQSAIRYIEAYNE